MGLVQAYLYHIFPYDYDTMTNLTQMLVSYYNLPSYSLTDFGTTSSISPEVTLLLEEYETDNSLLLHTCSIEQLVVVIQHPVLTAAGWNKLKSTSKA